MASILAGTLPWHEGERTMHRLLRVPPGDNPTVPSLSPGASLLLRKSPLLAIGAIDRDGRPWSTVWGGEVGFASPTSASTVEVKTPVDSKYDPLAEILLHDEDQLQSDQPQGFGSLLSGLVIDLETRRRAKLYGRKLSGSLAEDDAGGIAHLVVHIDASLGNCPKYLNIKHILPAKPEPRLISDSAQLPDEAVALISRADCLFVSSRRDTVDMDTNIRGGPPGFVRIVSNDPSGAVFVYPEYSGNRLYQTLGNLQTTPLAGYVFPDFENGDALYITGQTEVLIGKDAAVILPRSNLAVKVTVTVARYMEKALSFRGIPGAPSPYNPPVRYLTTEKPNLAILKNDSSVTATMIKKEILTPTIARFRFRISDPAAIGTWVPGQYATFSFQEELDMGYQHMQDDDPLSLNDDYVRTFTITSHPAKGLSAAEFEITVRRKGNVTNHLFRTYEGAGLEVPLKGFGGDFRLGMQGSQAILPFVAGGIGITPLIAQLSDLDIDRLRLFWTISVRDIGLVWDIFQQFPRLPRSTALFLTGPHPEDQETIQKLDTVASSGARTQHRRMESSDLDLSLGDVWYFCGSPALKAPVLNWLTGKSVVYEDFNY
ncbi:oxidoreductase FAD-binding protein [Aspergillus terreus]|uniref:Oxidoreductase FAD-binding protein n=1 Tax=Aspergillus terreus TaxID=33178 RepID=A0A5M3Z888_ASPTE|nr:hypothetical protein ATETN484_0009029100 [Aspergillus terreus]GFF17742.1 oxidoreductase FAD-binding protein [Aspergillus terreus]